MTPLQEHQLLVFWVQLAVLLALARGLGGLMRRIGQPPVIGELAAGLVAGPSLLGRVAPEVYAWLFPIDPVQSGLLLAVAWVGVALLLVVTGFETDLRLLANLGRQSAFVSTGSLILPLVGGFGLGWVMPAVFIGDAGDRTAFALFAAVALSISALPVIARILIDMNLMRRNLGQVTVAAAMANDLVGWVLLGTVAGIVTGGGFDVAGLGVTLLLLAVFLVAAVTVGQRLADLALRAARKQERGLVRSFTVVVLVTLFAGAITQAIGVEAVLGAFVAGIIIGRSRYQRPEVSQALETVTNAFFAPVFFATAGLFVDLGLLLDPQTALWAAAVIAVAAVTKLAGSFVGARLGGLPRLEGLAAGVGLNARGALEIVVATVGLSLDVLNAVSYTIVVVMAMATSMMAPPLLRLVLARLESEPEEVARLEREAVLERSVVANARTALLPTRGGDNSILAGRLLDLSLQPDTAVAIYTIDSADEGSVRLHADAAARTLHGVFGSRSVERIARTATDVGTAICTEASLGYGLVALGMTDQAVSGDRPSPLLQRLLTDCPVPMLLVRGGATIDSRSEDLSFRGIVVPAIGTRAGQAAQEIAYTLAARVDAAVNAVHVINRPDRQPAMVRVEGQEQAVGSVTAILGEAQARARQFGCSVTTSTRTGPSVGPELAAAADEQGADLIVVGARVRSYAGQPFLGHGVEYLLEQASQTVLVVVFPPVHDHG